MRHLNSATLLRLVPSRATSFGLHIYNALNYRGVTNVTFELCDVAQIDALLRVHRPSIVLAKNTIQFFAQVLILLS